ncbi:hypothetical protein D3C85_1143410 [compost metagenome]
MKSDAVLENTCASPVHPALSRVGQSVGTSMKLPFWLHLEFDTSCVISGFEQVKSPVSSKSEYTATAVKFSGVISPG